MKVELSSLTSSKDYPMIETWNFNWVLFTRIHNDHGIPCIYASLRQYIKHFWGSFNVAHIYIEHDESTIGASVLEETGQEHERTCFSKWVLKRIKTRPDGLGQMGLTDLYSWAKEKASPSLV